MNKEQQIEEMARDIYDQKSCDTSFEENCKILAYDLVTLGYQKIDKDSAVLSREEYKKLKSLPNKIIKYMDRHLGNGELCGNVVRNCAKQFGVEIKENNNER